MPAVESGVGIVGANREANGQKLALVEDLVGQTHFRRRLSGGITETPKEPKSNSSSAVAMGVSPALGFISKRKCGLSSLTRFMGRSHKDKVSSSSSGSSM